MEQEQEQEQAVNSELQRIEGILRLLWPGVTLTATPETWWIEGRCRRLKVSALVADPGCGESWALVLLDHHPLHKVFWRQPENAAGLLKGQRDFVHGYLDSLNAALGLGVSDG